MGNAGEGTGEEGEGPGEAGLGGDGDRVFFDSADDLSPGDTNGAEDVYEYEDGHVYLISDGNSPGGSSFVDASSDGDDIFFITRAQLVAGDSDQLVDLYDARAPHVSGEEVGTPTSSSSVCEGEDCRMPSPAAPALSSPASALFVGAGNALALPAPVTKPKPKPKPKPKKKKKRKKSKRSKHKNKSKKDKVRGKGKSLRATRAGAGRLRGAGS